MNTDDCTECVCYEDWNNCATPLDLIGNGICNDESNNADCFYDGGDCCGVCTNTDSCSECVCHEGAAPAIDLSCKPYFALILSISIGICSKSFKES